MTTRERELLITMALNFYTPSWPNGRLELRKLAHEIESDAEADTPKPDAVVAENATTEAATCKQSLQVPQPSAKSLEERARSVQAVLERDCCQFFSDALREKAQNIILSALRYVAEEAKAEEKQTRIKYQDIVYAVCNWIDRRLGMQSGVGVLAERDAVISALDAIRRKYLEGR